MLIVFRLDGIRMIVTINQRIPGKFDDSAITNVFINCFFSDLFNNNITH